MLLLIVTWCWPPAVCSSLDPRHHGCVEISRAHQRPQARRHCPTSTAGGWVGERIKAFSHASSFNRKTRHTFHQVRWFKALRTAPVSTESSLRQSWVRVRLGGKNEWVWSSRIFLHPLLFPLFFPLVQHLTGVQSLGQRRVSVVVWYSWGKCPLNWSPASVSVIPKAFCMFYPQHRVHLMNYIFKIKGVFWV